MTQVRGEPADAPGTAPRSDALLSEPTSSSISDGRTASRAVRLAALVAHPVALGLGFLVVHAWLIVANLTLPGLPMGDIEFVYPYWAGLGLNGFGWVGIDTSWVYPYPALLPMLAVLPFGPEGDGIAWLLLMAALNVVAMVAVAGVHRGGLRALAGWWWLVFLVALGPIALGRIDTVTVALSLIAAGILGDHPRWAGALIAAAAWVKVWPGALLLAALVALRARWQVLRGFLTVSITVIAFGLVLGAGLALLTPLTEQSRRGLQVESVVSTPWMWAAALDPDAVSIRYGQDILTWQVWGPGSEATALLVTPVLAVVVAAIIALGVIAARRGAVEARLLPPLVLALVAALIVVNKVGSPQFATWIAVPVVLGLIVRAHGGVSFTVPAGLALAIAALTQVMYPVQYGAVLNAEIWMLVVLTVRNLTYLMLLVWAVTALGREAFGRMEGVHPGVLSDLSETAQTADAPPPTAHEPPPARHDTRESP